MRLVRLALDAGFLGIDTANQRRHYDEAAVGEALDEAFAAVPLLSPRSARARQWRTI